MSGKSRFSVAGTAASAAINDAPTGPFVVLACGALLAASLAVAPRVRGTRTEAAA